jgi:hypothetical protein
VQYWDIVTRSFVIAWRHKYLWLLAVFAGESGGGASFNYSSPFQPNGKGRTSQDFANIPQQVATWLSQNIGLLVAIGVLFLILAIGFFILAAVCEGALVRASAEHDADRPFGLRVAWRTGLSTMGTIIRFRLLLIALALPIVIVVAALVFGITFAILSHSYGLAVALGLIGLLIFLAVFVYALYLGFLDRLGTRAVVLEQVGARAALVRGHRLLRKRLGRVLLVWLLSIAVGIAVGICAAIVLAIVVIPITVAGIAAYATGSALFWVVVIVGTVIFLPIALVVGGFINAQSSTYWTLAFRRFEIDQAPAYGYIPATPPVSPSAS